MNDNPIGFDWRFLPDIPAGGRVLIFHTDPCHPAEGLSAVFDRVITVSERLPSNTLCSQTGIYCLQASCVFPPFEPQSFDLIAFPDGLSVGARDPHRNLERLMMAVQQLLRPEGVLYLGFRNSWSHKRILRDSQNDQFHASLSNVQRLLHRTGFKDHRTYAMIPDHRTPVYVTPLSKKALGFTFGLYLRRSRRSRWLRSLIRPWIAEWFGRVVPGYGVVAKAAL